MRVLTEAAQKDRDAFDRYAKDAGCGCHTMPPCSYCTHPGNPMNQDEDETCWEDDPDTAMQKEYFKRGREWEIAQYKQHLAEHNPQIAGLCSWCRMETEAGRMTALTEKILESQRSCPTCGRGGAGTEGNGTGGLNICYDPWHEDIRA